MCRRLLDKIEENIPEDLKKETMKMVIEFGDLRHEEAHQQEAEYAVGADI